MRRGKPGRPSGLVRRWITIALYSRAVDAVDSHVGLKRSSVLSMATGKASRKRMAQVEKLRRGLKDLLIKSRLVPPLSESDALFDLSNVLFPAFDRAAGQCECVSKTFLGFSLRRNKCKEEHKGRCLTRLRWEDRGTAASFDSWQVHQWVAQSAGKGGRSLNRRIVCVPCYMSQFI